jgi:hypothetical protein
LFSCGFVRRFEPDQVHLKTRRRQKRLRRCRFGDAVPYGFRNQSTMRP